MDKLEQLAHWKNAAVDAVRAAGRDGAAALESVVFKNEVDLFAFFDCFRPNGAGVEKVFAKVACGDEIVQRLLKCYECTKESFNRDMYFIVRRPARATPERLVDLTTQHLDKVRQIAKSFRPEWIKTKQMHAGVIADAAELANLLVTVPDIEITRKPIPVQTQPDFDAPETILYDVVGDWFIGLDPVPSDALLLNEAFYSIACDYYLAYFLMWPLYRHSSEVEEPFTPYFELWAHGARAIFTKPGLVTIFVTGDW